MARDLLQEEVSRGTEQLPLPLPPSLGDGKQKTSFTSSLRVPPHFLMPGPPHWGPALSYTAQQDGSGQGPAPIPCILATPSGRHAYSPHPHRQLSRSAICLALCFSPLPRATQVLQMPRGGQDTKGLLRHICPLPCPFGTTSLDLV